jgi:hypothetical protein
MLHKALLSSPKEFRVSIGTQTYCTASVNKPSAMPGDLVTVTVRSNTGYGNVKVGVSPSVEVTKVSETTFTFVMPFTDVVVSASASALDFRISVSKTGQGTVTVTSLAKYGEVVTVTASPSKGYELSSVTASGVTLSGSGNTRTFTMPAKDVSLSVVFTFVAHCVITVQDYGRGEFGWHEKPTMINRIPIFNTRNGSAELTNVTWGNVSPYGNGAIRVWCGGSMQLAIANPATFTFDNGVVITLEDDTFGNGGNSSEVSKLPKQAGVKIGINFDPAPTRYSDPGQKS